MRTPSSALPAPPHGLLLGLGTPLPFFAATFLGAGFLAARNFTIFFFAGAFFAEARFTFAFFALLFAIFVSSNFFESGIALRVSYFLGILLCGLRLPMRQLSLPAAGSSTALRTVSLPESMAALTARFNSSGEVALTPTPPKASIILS